MNCWLCGKTSYFAWTVPADQEGKELTRVQHADGTQCYTLERLKFESEIKKDRGQLEMLFK